MASDVMREKSINIDNSVNHGAEPPMYLQRPSSARSQDVSHLLAKTFRHLFTRDTVDNNTVKNLDTSKGSHDEYHESYVAALNKVCTNGVLFYIGTAHFLNVFSNISAAAIHNYHDIHLFS